MAITKPTSKTATQAAFHLKLLNCAISRYRHKNLVIMKACADCCYGVFDLLNVFSKQEQDITALDHLSRTQAIHLNMQSCVYADAHRAVFKSAGKDPHNE